MNYEALGIYTEAKDSYENSKKQRVDKANELLRELREITDSLNNNPKRLDVDKIQTLVKELIKADEMMMLWMDKANGVCEKCDKMPLHFSLPTL